MNRTSPALLPYPFVSSPLPKRKRKAAYRLFHREDHFHGLSCPKLGFEGLLGLL